MESGPRRQIGDANVQSDYSHSQPRPDMRRMLEHLFTLEGIAEREVPTAARSLLELPLAVSRLFGVKSSGET